MTDQSELTALRERVEEAEERVAFWKGESEALRLQKDSYAESLRALRFEYDAAIARAERAQGTLREIVAFLRENDPRHLAHAAGIIRDVAVKCKRALAAGQDAEPDHIADASKMVGGRERRIWESLLASGPEALSALAKSKGPKS